MMSRIPGQDLDMNIRLFCVLLAATAGSAQAASMSWRVPVHAELEVAPGVVQTVPLLPMGTTLEYSDGVMGQASGFIVAGGAQMDPAASPWPGPLSPFVTKRAESDGRVVWRWQPTDDAAVEGTIRQVRLLGAQRDIVVIGHTRSGGVDRMLLAAIDHATGETLWRVDGEPGTVGYGVAPETDEFGDIVVTWYGAHRQYIAKYTVAGTLSWSASLPDADATWDDFRIATSDGFTYVAGRYSQAAPLVEYGVQIGLSAQGSGFAFVDRFPSTDNVAVAGLDAVDEFTGSVLFDAGGILRWLDPSGQTRWSQQSGVAMPRIVQVLDNLGAADELYVAGNVDTGQAQVAQIDSLSTVTGDSEWHMAFEAVAPRTAAYAQVLRSGYPNPGVLFGWVSEGGAAPRQMHVTALRDYTHEVLWQADFGSADLENENNPIDLRMAPRKNVFVLALTNDASEDSTATLYKLDSPSADDIFANGLE
ncbi:MAG: hypothetical protein ACTHK2_15465 [Dokdonella sp.]|uniref:hypothetical protein n=1 Tax=Dokdonella sp. TaxID=2291710 RepID=UPI003F819F9D